MVITPGLTVTAMNASTTSSVSVSPMSGVVYRSVPPLTAEQDEALDLVAAIAEESCLQQRFELGDLQLSSK